MYVFDLYRFFVEKAGWITGFSGGDEKHRQPDRKSDRHQPDIGH
jgi:hypothetical protein